MTTLTAGGVADSHAPASSSQRQPNRIALQITGRPYISFSQLSSMRACPKKFSLHYVEKAPPDFIPVSLIFGGSIHYAIECWLRARLEGLTMTQGAMLSAYHDAWRRQKQQAGDGVLVRFNKGDDDDTLHALADRMITAFVASPLANPNGTILGIEEELRVVLDPQLPDLLARVDLVTQTQGALHIMDFKTARSRWTEQKAIESGEQLLLYGVTLARMSRSLGLPAKLHFAILTKAKSPVVQIIPVPADADRVAAMKEGVGQVWQAIQAGNWFANPSPMNCTTCQYRSRCPMFGGRQRTSRQTTSPTFSRQTDLKFLDNA